MATETLHFENARFAQQLYNHEPRNLTSLETELGVKATSREGWIKLEGAAAGGGGGEGPRGVGSAGLWAGLCQ